MNQINADAANDTAESARVSGHGRLLCQREAYSPRRTGIVNCEHVEPPPTWLLTQILPPWSSAMGVCSVHFVEELAPRLQLVLTGFPRREDDLRSHIEPPTARL